jgi:hypothetical protein
MKMTEDDALSTYATNPKQTEAIIDLVVDGLTSVHSKRAYSKALAEFLNWYTENGYTVLTKAVASALLLCSIGNPRTQMHHFSSATLRHF